MSNHKIFFAVHEYVIDQRNHMHECLRKSKKKLMMNTLCRCTVSGFVGLGFFGGVCGLFSSKYEAE